MINYAKLITTYCNKTGVSQNALAEKIGLTRSRINKIALGRIKLNEDDLKKLEAFFNVQATHSK